MNIGGHNSDHNTFSPSHTTQIIIWLMTFQLDLIANIPSSESSFLTMVYPQGNIIAQEQGYVRLCSLITKITTTRILLGTYGASEKYLQNECIFPMLPFMGQHNHFWVCYLLEQHIYCAISQRYTHELLDPYSYPARQNTIMLF